MEAHSVVLVVDRDRLAGDRWDVVGSGFLALCLKGDLGTFYYCLLLVLGAV